MAAAEICETLIRFDQLDKHQIDPAKMNQKFGCLKIRDIGDVQFIIGPEEYSEYKITLPNGKIKTYHIFGESHRELVGYGFAKNQRCNIRNTLYISSFLNSLVTQFPDRKFDMFVESYLNEKFSVRKYGVPNQFSNISIPLIKNQFGICLNMRNESDRLACREKYPNLRANNADFRDFIEEDIKSGIYPKFFSSTYLSEDVKNSKRMHIGSTIREMTNEHFIQNTTLYIKRVLFNHPKIIKQLDAIGNPAIVAVIKSVIYGKLDEKTKKSIDFVKGIKREEGYYDFDDDEYMVAIYMYVMDMYAISRILRNFSNAINPKNINLRNYTGNSDSVIYYCGSHHKRVFDLVMSELIKKGLIRGTQTFDIKNPDKDYIEIEVFKSLMSNEYYKFNKKEAHLLRSGRELVPIPAFASAASDDQMEDDSHTLRPRNRFGKVAMPYYGAAAAAVDMVDDGGNYLVDFVNHCY